MDLGTKRRIARRCKAVAAGRSIPEAARWNHNIHYFQVLLDALPVDACSALDVGCGDGMLVRRLRERIESIVGIDLDVGEIELARAATPASDWAAPEFVHGDVMSHDFGRTFDAVLSVASLHHLDTEPALRRMAGLVSDGGVLVIQGLARSTNARDLLYDAVGSVLTQILKRTGSRTYYEHSAPIRPPKDSFSDIRSIALALLPGVRYQRHALWRYTLVWRRVASL